MSARPSAVLFAARLIAIILGLAAAEASAREALTPEAAQVLHSARSAELYSLEPYTDPDDAKVRRLEGYAILGHTRITTSQSAAAVLEIERSIAAWEDGPIALCFDPRHALRVRAEGHTYDFLVCYACEEMQVYKDGALVAFTHVRGSPSVLNAMLRKGNVPLSRSGDRGGE